MTQSLSSLRPRRVQEIIDSETSILEGKVGVTDMKAIPSTTQIPIKNKSAWIRIPDVIACFVDMEGSTKLSAESRDNTMARAYSYFANTGVRIFDHFGAEYIDVRGDAVLSLFNSDQTHSALAAMVSFKTFISRDFSPKMRRITGKEIGSHYGIDRKTVLVRKIGMKIVDGEIHRQNEVWAGKPINMAAKLASQSSDNELWVSDRYFLSLRNNKAIYSCGCRNGIEGYKPSLLWEKRSVEEDSKFDFDCVYVLKSEWCDIHGQYYLEDVVAEDSKSNRKSA